MATVTSLSINECLTLAATHGLNGHTVREASWWRANGYNFDRCVQPLANGYIGPELCKPVHDLVVLQAMVEAKGLKADVKFGRGSQARAYLDALKQAR